MERLTDPEWGNLVQRLGRSAFRRKFRLGPQDESYARRKGLAALETHAREFVGTRLAPAAPRRDGRQTPFRGHPVFVAQHATGCCCRGCLRKWHRIPEGRALTPEEVAYVVDVICRWLSDALAASPPCADLPGL